VISAVIPTYRGGARLRRNLSSVVEALDRTGEEWEVVVVDDGGGAIGALPEGVRLLPLPNNRGYGPAVNAGVGQARGGLALVLNDDVRLDPEAVVVLRRRFPDPSLFAAVPAIRSPLAACGDEGGKRGELTAGLVEIVEVPARDEHPTLYPVGCCFLCPRDLFLSLGGFDAVFAPYFWEDVDLGWRAWRRGLRIAHVPEATCDHEGSATLREHRTVAEREQVEFRNRALFHLRNLREPQLRAGLFGALAATALFEWRERKRAGLAEAVRQARQVLSEGGGLDDRAILARSAGA
jgi:GT2 family glycosyltransferase